MPNIKFVCSGNVFRSASAEHLMRQAVGDDSNLKFSSSGTRVNWSLSEEMRSKNVHPAVLNHLRDEYQIDLTHPNHTPRFYHPGVTDQDNVDVIVAMSGEHYRFLKADQDFGEIDEDIQIVFYNEVAKGKQWGILDVPDIFPDPNDRPEKAVRSFIETQIDYIAATVPEFLANLPKFLPYDPANDPRIDPQELHY